VLHIGIDLWKFGVIVNQVQHFFPCEIITPIEAGIHLSHELQIFGSIHRPAVIAEVSGVMEQGNVESAWGSASLQLAVDS
jgi:hypothetical protein